MFLKQMSDLKRKVDNMKNQGKSEKEIKRAISLYLKESKRQVNPNREKELV